MKARTEDDFLWSISVLSVLRERMETDTARAILDDMIARRESSLRAFYASRPTPRGFLHQFGE